MPDGARGARDPGWQRDVLGCFEQGSPDRADAQHGVNHCGMVADVDRPLEFIAKRLRVAEPMIERWGAAGNWFHVLKRVIPRRMISSRESGRRYSTFENAGRSASNGSHCEWRRAR
jgi:hypothetical protein